MCIRDSLSSDPQRLLKVAWADEAKQERIVRITLVASDRVGLLASVSKAVADCGAHIMYSSTTVNPATQKSTINFEFTVDSLSRLEEIRREIEMVPGVIKVKRVLSKK